MQETDFHDIVDNLYFQLEDIIDDSGVDIDYETSGGVMTLTCENDGSKIILSRQSSNSEIWVAARSGGYHFQYKDLAWICASGETLAQLLVRVIAEQAQQTLDIGFDS